MVPPVGNPARRGLTHSTSRAAGCGFGLDAATEGCVWRVSGVRPERRPGVLAACGIPNGLHLVKETAFLLRCSGVSRGGKEKYYIKNNC